MLVNMRVVMVFVAFIMVISVFLASGLDVVAVSVGVGMGVSMGVTVTMLDP